MVELIPTGENIFFDYVTAAEVEDAIKHEHLGAHPSIPSVSI
jgi:hypothetical protein